MAADTELSIALAGNPNVGKSTVFNALTGLHQHTGNWPGKTVELADGVFRYGGQTCRITDLPGTYSLMSRSEEEAVARDFILFGGADCTVVVCDAAGLERGLNLVLQTAQLTDRVVVCVNLMDEAERKGIQIDFERLEKELGMPVVPTDARSKRGLSRLMAAIRGLPAYRKVHACRTVHYSKLIEDAARELIPAVERGAGDVVNPRFAALKLLEGDPDMMASLKKYTGTEWIDRLQPQIGRICTGLSERFMDEEHLRDELAETTVRAAAAIASRCVRIPQEADRRDRRIDRVLTGKFTGPLMMLALLGVVFFLTISGANVPSDALMAGFTRLGEVLREGLDAAGAPDWILLPLIDGVYRTLTWVVSVMLPPMAGFKKNRKASKVLIYLGLEALRFFQLSYSFQWLI